MKCIIGGQGHNSRGAAVLTRFYRDPKNMKKLLPVEHGGVLSPEKPELHVQYEKESRFSLGVAKVKMLSGETIGKNADAFDYNGGWMHSISSFKVRTAARIAHIKALEGDGRTIWNAKRDTKA